jgi:hypothetical protein
VTKENEFNRLHNEFSACRSAFQNNRLLGRVSV